MATLHKSVNGRALRKAVIATAREFHRQGWVANHDGNITAKLSANQFLATPTATSKVDVDEQNLIEVDANGKKIAGTARGFSELAVHMALYRARPDIGSVVHAHPPYATALACSGNQVLDRPFVAEAVVSIGDRIPLLPFVIPGPGLASQIAEASHGVDAVLCANHGVFAWGRDLELAHRRLELVEHLAKIATFAIASGGVQYLPTDAVAALLAKRAKSGLGAAADRAGAVASKQASSPKRVIACAPAPHASVEVIEPRTRSNSELVKAIREELVAVLGELEQ